MKLNLHKIPVLPYEKRKDYLEHKDQRGWIKQGNDNLYPNYLLKLINSSSTHGAIIKTKSVLIGGAGFDETGLTPDTLNFLLNTNNNDDLSDILFKISHDLEAFGYFTLNVIWSEDRQSIAEISYINAATVRFAINDEDKYRNLPPVQHYFVSDDWINTQKNKPVFYQGFSDIYKEKDGDFKGNPNQIVFVGEFKSQSSNQYYPLPDWISAEKWLLIESAIADFHLNNVTNSFAPSYHINFSSGVPSMEDMEEAVKKIKEQFQGTKNAGEILVTYSDGKDTSPEINPFTPNTNDEMFQTLINQVRDNIFVANRIVDQTLHGLVIAGSLGTADGNTINSLAVFQSMYIDPKQKLIERTFQDLASVNGITDEIKIAKYKIDLPITIDINSVMNILQSGLTSTQQVALLVSLGYEKADAESLMKNNDTK